MAATPTESPMRAGRWHGFAYGGQGKGRNPYSPKSRLYSAWLDGWNAQKAGKSYGETVRPRLPSST